MEQKLRAFRTSDINFKNDRQKQIFKFILKVLKTFNENDVKTRREIGLFIDKSSSQEYVVNVDLLTFKSSVENWLRSKYLKFSEQEVRYLVSKIKDYKGKGLIVNDEQTDDSKGWMLFCLTVEPKPEPAKEKRDINRVSKKDKIESVNFDFDIEEDS